MNVELPVEMTDFVKSLVAEGRYESEAAVLQEGLRILLSREKLHREIQIGLDSLNAGQWEDEETVFAEVEAEIKRIEEKRGSIE